MVRERREAAAVTFLRRQSSSNGVVITVEREPDQARDVWRWRISGAELENTGICLGEVRAWQAAKDAADPPREAA